jgi:transposase
MEFLGKGHSQREAQKVFGLALATVQQWYKQYRATGSLASNYLSRRSRKLNMEKLKTYVNEHPDAYLKEIGEVFGCSDVAVFYAFRRFGITRKKR